MNDMENTKDIAKDVLKWQRYIIRKTYGVYYALWAGLITIFTFSPYFIFNVFNSKYSVILLIITYLLAESLGFWFTRKIFRKTNRTIEFNSALEKNKNNSKKRNPWKLGILIIIIISAVEYALAITAKDLVGYIFYSLLGASILYLLIGIILYISLKGIFNNIPLEGKLASFSLIGGGLVNLLPSLYFGFPLWVLTSIIIILTWLFSSIFALYYAPTELIDND
ncbi:hypothetical protein CM19_04365 [Candidatus Acidianus copahuensis]|uniref:Uncharacterized protein n=3 Tax=Acidianus TaxID=12914 RepID=A0A031LR21_9CREN|nr:hypothetical protein [Candidatus Acidianus copahuensis]EZQ10185.1 hypothetical protein CM19_04365 [Candidatus Acidianus copahuensis]